MRDAFRGGEAGLAAAWAPASVRVVGIAGHRRFDDPAIGRFVARGCRAILRRVRAASPGCVALSPLAEGADTAFAEAALELGIELDVIRAHAAFGDDFATARARSRYRRLRERARRRADLAFDAPCDEAFEAAMNRVVEGSDLLVVAWDGGPPGGRGGTAHAVRRATELGRPWIHLDTRRATVRAHGMPAADADLLTRLQGGPRG
jgi:hypothetical protein